MGKIRGKHSSPGIYTQITDLQYAAKTMGITTLGLAGETEKGPAFEPIPISNWDEFNTTFGGLNTELFKDSKYPKYELPYIAKSYLTASEQLYVCRVLGLSGYKAGNAFIITASKSGDTTNKKYVIAVLRSRGHYEKYGTNSKCDTGGTYDTLIFDCDKIELSPYSATTVTTNACATGVTASTTVNSAITINSTNLGKFTIQCKRNNTNVGNPYTVSLNPGAKDYIYTVLGSSPTNGNAHVFVEELYDYYLEDLINHEGINQINTEVTTINDVTLEPIAEPVKSFVTIPNKRLNLSHVGKTFIYDDKYAKKAELTTVNKQDNSYVSYWKSDSEPSETMKNGCIYQVTKNDNEYKYEAVKKRKR